MTKIERSAAPKIDPALREKALRQANKVAVEPVSDEPVKVRVLKMGDGKISTGQHVPGVGEVHFEKGEETTLPKSIAVGLEDRGYLEIVEP